MIERDGEFALPTWVARTNGKLHREHFLNSIEMRISITGTEILDKFLKSLSVVLVSIGTIRLIPR